MPVARKRPVSRAGGAKVSPRRRASVTRVPKGRIITFYSYKGGTGRSMALANIAWILASRGERVLAIDWDLEAPGLHRYFRPFIEDKELTRSTGLIDFLGDFVEGARLSARAATKGWFAPYAHLERHAFSLEWEFPGLGTLDLVPAGRQGASYAMRVTSFDWAGFYERLGGGIFLEEVKRNLRAEYDYILIDSRTGISDTSGICTVQMPDELVVCFTLNRQSIAGAAATADSAFQQRMTPKRAPGIKVWPVPMRVELGERELLERARDEVRPRFQELLHHLSDRARHSYWGSVEVLYHPFFAYDEVLATLAERREQTGSLLKSFEYLAGCLTGGRVKSLGTVNELKRRAAVSAYADVTIGPFFLSYSREDEGFALRLANALQGKFGSDAVFYLDRDVEKGGDLWRQTLSAAMNKAQAIVPILSKSYAANELAAREASYALERGLVTVPVLVPTASWTDIADTKGHLRSVGNHTAFMFGSGSFKDQVEQLATILQSAAKSSFAGLAKVEPSDPVRGRFGGRSQRDGWSLTATVKPPADGNVWFDVTLQVSADKGPAGDPTEVELHLHPTFNRAIRLVKTKRGVAKLTLEAWGAFTVGAVVLKNFTQLELDLSTLRSAPKAFRER